MSIQHSRSFQYTYCFKRKGNPHHRGAFIVQVAPSLHKICYYSPTLPQVPIAIHKSGSSTCFSCMTLFHCIELTGSSCYFIIYCSSSMSSGVSIIRAPFGGNFWLLQLASLNRYPYIAFGPLKITIMMLALCKANIFEYLNSLIFQTSLK